MVTKLSTSWGPLVLSHVELVMMEVGRPRIFGSGGAGFAKYPRSASFRGRQIGDSVVVNDSGGMEFNHKYLVARVWSQAE
jgi:hypothetical protein